MISHLRIAYLAFLNVFSAGVSINIGNSFSKFVQIGNDGVRFNGYMEAIQDTRLMTCFVLCMGTEGCIYIGFQSGVNLCLLHQRNSTLVQETDPHWTNYAMILDENGFTTMDPMTGAIADQSTIYMGQTADLAIDGDFTNTYYYCSHTNDFYSYWILTFGVPAVITSVDIYLRSDFVERNSHKAALISQTHDDAVDNIGIECGRYTGPLIDTAPFILSIECEKPLYGNVLRISHLTDQLMELCEVVVNL